MTPLEIVESQRAAFLAADAGLVVAPERLRMNAERGEVLIMPASAAATGHFGVKILTGFPGNPARGLPANQAVVVLGDLESGAVRAILDGTWITAARTGATAALALDVAGPREIQTLAIMGSGPVADWAIRCCVAVRQPAEVRIWSRAREHAGALATRVRRHVPPNVRISVVADAIDAAAGAEAIVTATQAARPLLSAADVASAAHVSAMGGAEPAWEIQAELLDRAVLITDSPAAWREASDIAQARGRAGRDPLLLGALCRDSSALSAVKGTRPTVFRGVGVAFQDLYLAIAALERRLQSPS
ncbi:MAG: hypothetical protein WD830_08570 [Chloroflexota bacterium]